jgi:multicomponent Na+:H+ antiporter subunit C
MNAGLLYGLTGLALFGLGFAALFIRRSLLRKILAINICGSGIFLLMISVAYDPAGGAPDPVLHALVLTGIVITVSITAFALALADGRSDRHEGEPRPRREPGREERP